MWRMEVWGNVGAWRGQKGWLMVPPRVLPPLPPSLPPSAPPHRQWPPPAAAIEGLVQTWGTCGGAWKKVDHRLNGLQIAPGTL